MSARPLMVHLRPVLTWACVVAWAAAFVVSHTPVERLPDIETSDKTLHLIGYAGLTAVFWLALRAHGRPARRRVLLCLLVMPVYGAFDELTQGLVGRDASALDWLFDLIGALAAMGLLEAFELTRRRLATRRVRG